MEKYPLILIIPVLLIITAISYAPAFNSGYLFDDHILIEQNPSIREARNIPRFFISKEARVPMDFSKLQDDVYRPLQIVSYTLSYLLWGNKARPLHAENVIIHLLNGILLYLLMRRVLKNGPAAFLAGVFFLIHPVQVEAVTYLSGRADLLSLFFFLASFLAYIRSGESDGIRGAILKIFSVAAFGMSLLSKEMTVTLPVIIFFYGIFICRNGKSRSPGRIIKEIFPYLFILVVYLIARTHNLGHVAQKAGEGAYSTFFIMVRAFSEYLRLIFFPARLTFYHDFDLYPLSLNASYIVYFAAALLLLYLCGLAIKKDKRQAFLISSYLVSLLPVSNIITIKVFMQERFLYLPSVFILSAVSYMLVKAANSAPALRGKKIFKLPLAAILAAVVILLMSATFSRNLDWKDQRTFMLKEAKMHPDRGLFYFDLGHRSFLDGNYDDAVASLEKALQRNLSPIHRTMAHDTLGNCYRDKGQYDKAVDSYRKALEITPRYAYSLNSLGECYFNQQRYEKAGYFFEKAVSEWPDDAIFNGNLGTACAMLGEKEKALKYWRKSLEIDPDQPDIRALVSKGEK